MEDVGTWLLRWRRQGLTTPDAVRADSARKRALNEQLSEIYDACGIEKRATQPDRDLLSIWMGEMGMSMELVLLAAQYARGSAAPMKAAGRILSDWHSAGISTCEAARTEHEAHRQGAGQAAPAAAKARTSDVLMRHAYTQEDYSRMVVDLDEEDE